MISRLEKFFRQTRVSISRNQWLVRILGLSDGREVPFDERPRGLVIIQIDGLAKPQLEKALDQKSMPFLKRLLVNEQYQMHSLYTGQPSSTPSVQGELFYGIKGCVPAFSFKRHDDQRTVIMLEPNAAATVEAQLAVEGGEPLLKGGSTFSNIFTGGAKESSFCASSLGWASMMPTNNPLKMAVFGLLNILSIIRVLVLMIIELGLAIADFFRGLIDGRDLVKELTYVPTRVAACILMRELVTIGVCLDATRGLPIIHANLIGYDEQAHRRGPSSKFAHWSLKGIDKAIHRIWATARRSQYRDYDIWVYSDHGQEAVIPYPKTDGTTIQTAVQRVFAEQRKRKSAESNTHDSPDQLDKTWSRRAKWLGLPKFGGRFNELDRRTISFTSTELPEVVAMGPIGFVYLPNNEGHNSLSFEEKKNIAAAMVAEGGVPITMLPDATAPAQTRVIAWTEEGRFRLPRDSAKVLGETHPFAHDIGDDFAALVCHPDAGDLVISGWIPNASPFSFRMENGSHAGPGFNETHAFALIPGDTPLPPIKKNYLRLLDLREAAFKVLGRSLDRLGKQQKPVDEHKQLAIAPSPKPPEHQHCLRVLTYNIHSCIGMDGVVSTARIARVIAHYQPDVVALQELDVDRAKTDHIDQAQLIAEELSMDIHFHPVKHLEQGRFGNAILTDLPMRRVQAGPLSVPALNRKRMANLPFNEPRGAIWVEIDFHGQPVNLINTHLGLTPRERRQQVDTLLSEDWLNSPNCGGATILCGDFNATPRQQAIRRLTQHLNNAQTELYGRAAKKTFAGRYPTICIDHVMVDRSTKVKAALVPNDSLAKVASDHLPLVVDLEISSL